tara:strand:+ start:36863 stop:37948 length:1086 start_codon:yes stop_codon:yes gene_type:complete
MNDLLAAWWDLVVLGSLQNLPLLLVALLIDRIFARLAWTSPRRVVWAVVVLELLLPPALGSPVHVAGAAPLAVPLHGAVTATLPFWLFVAWAVGALLVAMNFAIGSRRLRTRLLAQAQPLPLHLDAMVATVSQRMKLRRIPRVMMSASIPGACVLGVVRPVVLLDAATANSADGQVLEHTLLHEFGHVKRRDALRAWCMRSLLCSWWFHPTAWLAARRFAFLREVGCDRLVTDVLGGRSAYCKTLAARVIELEQPAAAPAFVRLPAEVLQRVTAMRAAGRRRGTLAVASVAACALLLLCSIPLTSAAISQLPFGVASLNELPGCMTKRYFVLSQLHQSQSTASQAIGSQATTSPATTQRPQ